MPVRTRALFQPALFQMEEGLPSIRGRRSPNLKDAGYDRSVAACFECWRRGARAWRCSSGSQSQQDIPPDRDRRLQPDADRAALVDAGALGGDAADGFIGSSGPGLTTANILTSPRRRFMWSRPSWVVLEHATEAMDTPVCRFPDPVPA